MRGVCVGFVCVLCSVPVWAQDVFVMEEVVVRDRADMVGREVLPRGRIASGVAVNAGEAVTRVPGVSAVTRGSNAAEPVIRGLGWERVVTRMEGLPLFSSCPARMDPPATYASPEILSEVTVVKALPSVTLGPNATAGLVILSTDYDRGAGATNEVGWTVQATYNGARDGFLSSLASQGGSTATDYRAGGSLVDLGNYTSADGIEVPAELREYGASFSLGRRIGEDDRLSGNVVFRKIDFASFPALPMDTDDSEASILNTAYRLRNNGSAFSEVRVLLGAADIDHRMSNRKKPNRGKLEAETVSESQSLALTLAGDLESGEQVVTVGLDLYAFRRDALRTRNLTATGKTFQDPIWPDTRQDLAGLFAETTHEPAADLSLRWGVRVDAVRSDASDRGRTGYVRYYGPEAADIARDEWLASGNVLADWAATDDWIMFGGVGLASRAAGLTERYFLLAPAPGGFQVGNPALDPEFKLEANLGGRYESDRLRAEVSLFGAQVNDYILTTQIAREDVNADGIVDSVRGFENIDAWLHGGELALDWALTTWLSLPANLAYVRGRNTSDDRDLPEIPPLNGFAALRATGWSAIRGWLETGVIFAARQDRVDEAFPENSTPSWYALHLKAGCTVREAWGFEIGIENLLDQEYHRHLTREALLPVGDLAAGQEIPEPGRFLYATLTYDY